MSDTRKEKAFGCDIRITRLSILSWLNFLLPPPHHVSYACLQWSLLLCYWFDAGDNFWFLLPKMAPSGSKVEIFIVRKVMGLLSHKAQHPGPLLEVAQCTSNQPMLAQKRLRELKVDMSSHDQHSIKTSFLGLRTHYRVWLWPISLNWVYNIPLENWDAENINVHSHTSLQSKWPWNYSQFWSSLWINWPTSVGILLR